MLLLVCLIFCATSIQDLKEQAEILGLKGDDIPKFVLQQQAYQREERAREREEREKEREKERQREERESEHKINQSIMGGIRQGARCLAYPTAPLLAATPRESPCRLPSYTE